jgi:O-antigen/teichoic acid export membrane protein
LIGGIFVLLLWRDLYAFLIWTALNALLEVLAYALVCRWIHPSMPVRPGVSWLALRRVWRFSLTMNALAILTVLLVQIDRLLISKMLTLEALGSYSLAYTTAAIIPAVISAIGSAVLPSFAAAHGQGSNELLTQRYDLASRLMLYTIGLVAAVLVFFGEPLLALWVNAPAAAGASRSLGLLAIGFLGSAAVSNAYQVAIATGRPNVALKVSFLSAPPYVLVLYLLILEFGVDGAALAWLLLNTAYVIFLLPRVHHHILGIPVTPYLFHVLLPPIALAVLSFGLARFLVTEFPSSSRPAADATALLFSALAYLSIGYLLIGRKAQAIIKSTLRLNQRVF